MQVLSAPQPPRFATGAVPPRAAPTLVRRPGFVVPAADERRFVPNEVLLTIRADLAPADLRSFERQYDLVPLASSRVGLLNVDVRRYAIRGRLDVRQTIQSLTSGPSFVASVQPNYRFSLQDDTRFAARTTADPMLPTRLATTTASDRPVQYAIDALHIDPAHRLSTGAHVLIAVIDTGLDEHHPDLAGMVADRFDAVGGIFRPHSHGTAMAGVIVAHKSLVGIAPDARILAIRAFSSLSEGGADGTGYDILRGLDFAAAHGARVVNMSFAGPKDKLLGEALRAARDRGIITVAAAGNAGPTSEPLYPAAEPGVIAVTATDAHNKVFAMANRGDYIAFAAPGVNILAPSVGGTMQLTSGTSVATAEASGVVALLIQRQARVSADEVRGILRETAARLATGSAAGAGVIDAFAALNAMSP